MLKQLGDWNSLAVSFNHGWLDHDEYPPGVVIPFRRLCPLEFDQRHRGGDANVRGRSFNGHVNAAQLTETFPRAFWQALRNVVEVSVKTNEHSVFANRMSLHNGVRTIYR